jgi:hypothetical protein
MIRRHVARDEKDARTYHSNNIQYVRVGIHSVFHQDYIMDMPDHEKCPYKVVETGSIRNPQNWVF